MGFKIDAMARIAQETDQKGQSPFPRFMMENMKLWESEGLVTLGRDNLGDHAKITLSGRKLAKKAMR